MRNDLFMALVIMIAFSKEKIWNSSYLLYALLRQS